MCFLCTHSVSLLCTPSSQQLDVWEKDLTSWSRAASVTQTPAVLLPCSSLPGQRSYPEHQPRCHEQPLQESSGGLGLGFCLNTLSSVSETRQVSKDKALQTRQVSKDKALGTVEGTSKSSELKPLSLKVKNLSDPLCKKEQVSNKGSGGSVS